MRFKLESRLGTLCGKQTPLLSAFQIIASTNVFARLRAVLPPICERSRLILTGVSTNSCVLFTANDAYMRDLKLVVPEDCVAACHLQEHKLAIEQIRTMLKADTRPSTELDFAALASSCPD